MFGNRLVATVVMAFGMSVAAVVAAEPPAATPDGQLNQPEQPPDHIIRVEIGFEPGPLEEPATTPSAIPAPAPSPAPAPAPSPAPVVTQTSEPPIVPVPAPVTMPVPAPVVVTAPVTMPAPASVVVTAPVTMPVPAPVVVTAPPSSLPPPAPMSVPASPKRTALSLAALERMALSRVYAPAPPPPGGGAIVQAGSWAEKDGVASLDGAELPQGFVDKVVPAIAPAGVQLTPEMLAQQYRLLNSVRLRYYHLLALQKLIAVREDLASISRDAVVAIEAMIASGQVTKAELLQVRIEAREQMAAVQSARAVYEAVWHRMAVTVGQPDLPVGPLAGDVEQCCATPGFEAAWAHVLEFSPELLVVRAEVARRQATLRQSLATSGGKASDTSASDGVIGQALIWFSGPATPREPQIKQAAWTDLAHWESEAGHLEQSLKQRLADAYARLERAKQMTDLYLAHNLPDAREAFELSVTGFRQGRGSWPQVQIAQRNYFRMSNEYVEALAEQRRAELVILGLLMDSPG